MKPYQRHTEMTHHILGEDDEYRDWWYWEDYHEDWKENDVDYDINRKFSGTRYLIRKNRWRFPISISYNPFKIVDEFINEVDMKSFYSLQKKREMTLDEIFDEVSDYRNTIGNMINYITA